MFNNFGYPYGGGIGSYPTATQPYGYSMSQPQMQMAQQMQQPQMAQQQMAQPQAQTNIIYVNGVEDVRNRPLPPNSNYAFMDNDNPILYHKTVDAQGKMTVEMFDIVPHKEKPVQQPEYALKSDIAELQKQIVKLQAEVLKNVGNGSNTATGAGSASIHQQTNSGK